MWMLAWACQDTTPDATTTTDTPPEPTSDTTEPPLPTTDVVDAQCTLTENALRASCDLTLAEPGTATVTFTAPGAPPRQFSQTGDSAVSVLAWGLRAGTTYTWASGEHTGSLTTGPLPAALAGATITVTGEAFGFDAVLYPMRCTGTDYFTMIDPEGSIVWYEPNSVYFDGTMAGYDWDAASQTLLTAGPSTFQEQALDGSVVLELTRGADFAADHDLHHDIDRWGDYRYLLFEYPVGELFVDGVHVFEGERLLGTFWLEDHYTVPTTGTGDWSHGNAVKVSDDGEVVLSLHTFSSIVAFDGDPASPTFLSLTWLANGLASGLPQPDYTPAGGERFERQHNTSRHGDDLWVFDNQSEPQSRAVRFAMDPAAGTLTETGSWSFDRVCMNQGGAIPVDGGALVSCANAAKVWEFLDAATEPAWTLDARCDEIGGTGTLPLLRAIPVDIG